VIPIFLVISSESCIGSRVLRDHGSIPHFRSSCRLRLTHGDVTALVSVRKAGDGSSSVDVDFRESKLDSGASGRFISLPMLLQASAARGTMLYN
jgi:hypothetical protein